MSRVVDDDRRAVRAARFYLGEDELAVISLPLQSVSLDEAGLSEAEASVATLVLQGASNAEIAELRGTSPRTVANQIASIFDKLDVSSRAELSALLARGTLPSD